MEQFIEWYNKIEQKIMTSEDWWTLAREVSLRLNKTVDGSACARCRQELKQELEKIIKENGNE
jgi:hypothetical protein